eukprot:1755043-Rhodomonas_salina.4
MSVGLRPGRLSLSHGRTSAGCRLHCKPGPEVPTNWQKFTDSASDTQAEPEVAAAFCPGFQVCQSLSGCASTEVCNH